MPPMNPIAPSDETLCDQRMRAETNKLLAEMFKLAAEQYKLNAEGPKMTHERAWYPAVAMATAAVAGAAIAGVMLKLFG